MKKVDRWAALTAALLLTVSLASASQAAEAGEKIVILHTNDVHCALDDAIGYAGLAAYAGALEEQYGATDSEEMQRKIGAKMGALLAEAQIIAANEYNASEGAQLMQESNLALVQGIRDDSVLQKEYYNAGYTMGEEFSQGILAARMENAFSPVDYGLAPEEVTDRGAGSPLFTGRVKE